MTTETAASPARLTLYAIVAAVTGSLFITVTGFLTVAAVIWALGMTLHLPMLAIEIGEVLAGIGAVVLTVILIRGALALERQRLTGELV
ncbi:MAG TPA: hypothetical protein DF715_08055 [Oceanicaulis sp.]|uniref:Uncharacterized protein n=1 Tax=Glycocaulis albus TaxID=1382801 RepID=A0ABQ1XQ90_9PROT|nr:hypothetical protein [Glycocaulis albus]GGH00131.1 hypothetical protein GCM10007420_15070 [Glycocaulis albus]HCY55463.1 hypothetical protein [Oceanicaulis sp.]